MNYLYSKEPFVAIKVKGFYKTVYNFRVFNVEYTLISMSNTTYIAS